MTDPLSMLPHDEELLAEITLLTDLMIAANAADVRVDPNAIDLILRRPPLAGAPIWAPVVSHQRTRRLRRTPDPGGQRARALAREIAILHRAIEIHQIEMARFTQLGRYDRADLVSRRLKHVRELLHQALLQQQEELLHQDDAAMGNGFGPDAVGHAVADGSTVSVCGLDLAPMMDVGQDFSGSWLNGDAASAQPRSQAANER